MWSSGLNRPPQYLAVLHAAAIFSLSGGRADAAWWTVEADETPRGSIAGQSFRWKAGPGYPKENAIDFSFFLTFSVISPFETGLSADHERLVRGQPPQNPTFSIKPVFPHGYQQCWTRTVLFWVWILVQPSVWLWRGGLGKVLGKQIHFLRFEKVTGL